MTTTQASRIERLFKVHPKERRLVALVAMVFAGTQSTHALSVNTADSLFFARFGVENLPVMFMILGVVTFGVLFAYSAGLGTLKRSLFYPGLLLAAAAVMVGLRLLLVFDGSWVYPIIWVSSNMLVLVTLTFMWNLAGDVVDTRSAKRLFPLFASAGILGGVMGNLATGPLARTIGTQNLLIVIAVIFVLTDIATRAVAVGIAPKPRSDRPFAEMGRSLAVGFSSPLLRLVALGMILGGALFSLVVFPFSVEVADAFDTEAEIASYLGLFSAAATFATFLISLFLVNRLFARVGVVVAWFLVAMVYVGGFTLWLVSLTLVSASIVRFTQWIAVNAVGATARTAMFNVLRSEQRGGVIAAYAAVPAQVGLGMAGALLWISQKIGPEAGVTTGLVLALVLAIVVWRMRRSYVGSLIDSLRVGEVAAFAGSAQGVAGFETSAEATEVAHQGLADPSPAVRRMAVVMLGRMDATEATPQIVDMLGDDDLEVRMAALDALEHLAAVSEAEGKRPDPDAVLGALFPQAGFAGGFEDAPLRAKVQAARWLVAAGEHRAATDVVMALFTSDDLESRRAACRVVAATGWVPDRELVASALSSDPSDAVRMAAVEAVAATHGPGPELAAALTDLVPRVRMTAAHAWADLDGGAQEPMAVLREGPDWTWEAAVTALAPNAASVRDEVYEWAEPQVAALAMFAGQVRTIDMQVEDRTAMPATEYLGWMLGDRLAAAHRVAVRVLGLLEDEETVRLIIDGLRSDDVESRAQALEAAESIGGALGRITVPVLETAAPPLYTPHQVLESLSHDWDRGLRVLALLSVRELALREWASIVLPATADDDPMVHGTAQGIATRMELEMNDSLETMGVADRMLLLRSVSIFEELMFDDLEQLATVAAERRFEDGDEIFHQGDEGPEMFVIAEGEVEVRSADGEVLFRLARGEELGELTALSGRPRPASAYAVGDVTALSLDATSLSNLILDRPEVARQMLANIAVRLADALEGTPLAEG